MDEQRLRSFLLARGLIERAELAVDDTSPGAMAAVVLCDLAVETAAKATAAAYPNSGFPGSGYILTNQQRSQPRGRDPSLPRILDELLASARERHRDERLMPSEIAGAARLHERRNSVQHDASVPSTEEILRSHVRALDFVQWVAGDFFGVALEELSRASLVRSADVRGLIRQAETCAASGDYDGALRELAIAFETARHEFRRGEPYRRASRRLSGHDVRRAIGPLALDSSSRNRSGNKRDLERLLEALVERSELAEDRLEAVSLGAQASDYAWFRRRAPRAQMTLGGAWHVYSLHETPARRHEYVRALDFVTSIALHWQQFPEPASTEPTAELAAETGEGDDPGSTG